MKRLKYLWIKTPFEYIQKVEVPRNTGARTYGKRVDRYKSVIRWALYSIYTRVV